MKARTALASGTKERAVEGKRPPPHGGMGAGKGDTLLCPPSPARFFFGTFFLPMQKESGTLSLVKAKTIKQLKAMHLT